MKSITYQVEFFSFWHAGSGLSGGARADLLVNKDSDGLPFLPGRTLKGLLRDAALMIKNSVPELVKDEFISEVFGQQHLQKDQEAELYAKEGAAFFTNASLSDKLRAGLRENNHFAPYLYRVLSATKIDAAGVAKDHTLRQLEVTVPLTLYARIEHFPEETDYLDQLVHCMNGVKGMGLNRSRGLGRCQFSIITE